MGARVIDQSLVGKENHFLFDYHVSDPLHPAHVGLSINRENKGVDSSGGGCNVRAKCLRSVQLLIELRVFLQHQHLVGSKTSMR